MRFEEQRGGAVAPAMPQAVEESAVGEALGGERGPGNLTAQAFETVTVGGRHGDTGVQRETRGAGAEGDRRP
jgi:hypothetical protein